MEDALKKAFGRILHRYRTSKGVSQQEMADNCSVERAYISRLERGLSQPTIGVFIRIADYLEISPADLMMEVDISRKKKR